MNITKALKQKNKLVSKTNEYISHVAAYNSIQEGTTRPYDAKEALEKAMTSVDELVALKTAIHKANAKVYDKIFKLAELKSLVSKLKGLDCKEGMHQSYRMDAPVKYTSQISIVEKDQLIEKLESQIEMLQEELEAHNAKTKI
jgi:hypothetical protein